MSGLFATFNTARNGMSVQQKAIDVTSHNIANSNTVGYSRQRAIIETTRPFGMPSMNNSVGPGQIGTGAQISSISRVRDTFLDYQLRVENSTKGNYEAREKYLSEVESILNEPADTGISNLISKFYDSWQQLSKSPETSNARTVVAQQSKALATQLNQTYNQLEKLKGNTQEEIKQSVVDINSILNQMDKLNQEIISVKVGGSEPNDLMDKRDLLADELSRKFGIQIDKKSLYGENLKPADIVGFEDAYKDSVALVKSNPNEAVMRFSYVSSIKEITSGTYEVTYYKNGDMSTEDNAVTINMQLNNEQYKELNESRVLWSDREGYAIAGDGKRVEGISDNNPIVEGSIPGLANADMNNLKFFKPANGELKGFMSVQEDIDKYIGQLNQLAKALALSVNSVHSGKTDVANDLNPFFVNKDDKTNEMGITAANIAMNEDIINDVMNINAGEELNFKDDGTQNPNMAATDGSRALAIATLRDKLIKIQDMDESQTRNYIFTENQISNSGMKFESTPGGMKIDSYFKDIVNRLGVQTQEAKRIVQNQGNLLSNLEESRSSISGVSQDEEMANLIQFQHAYSANAKVIATVDELLEVVINGLKR